MRLAFKGKCTTRQLSRHINKLVSDVIERAELNPEIEVILENPELNIIFKNGEDEAYLTVPREVNGQEVMEIFTVAVPLDEKGKIKASVDNEEESLVDEKTLAEANGLEYEYKEIVSEYADDSLELLEVFGGETEDDAKSVRYKVKGTNLEVLQFFKGDKLVAEQIIDPTLKE